MFPNFTTDTYQIASQISLPQTVVSAETSALELLDISSLSTFHLSRKQKPYMKFQCFLARKQVYRTKIPPQPSLLLLASASRPQLSRVAPSRGTSSRVYRDCGAGSFWSETRCECWGHVAQLTWAADGRTSGFYIRQSGDGRSRAALADFNSIAGDRSSEERERGNPVFSCWDKPVTRYSVSECTLVRQCRPCPTAPATRVCMRAWVCGWADRCACAAFDIRFRCRRRHAGAARQWPFNFDHFRGGGAKPWSICK